MKRKLIGLLFGVCAMVFMLCVVVAYPAYAIFEDFTTESGITPIPQGDDAAAVVDFDNDGDLDIVISHRGGSGIGLRLYENDSEGHFSDITASTGLGLIEGKMLSWADFDNDGDQDLCFVTSDNLLLFLNELIETDSLTFVQFLTIPGNWRLPSWIDYDHDGDLDLYVGGIYGGIPNAMFHNNLTEIGTVTFTDVTSDIGLNSSNNDDTQSIAWVDVDNDGDIDLYLTKGSGAKGYPGSDQLFRNNLETGVADFTEITSEVGLDSSKTYAFSGTWADYDNDKDMDLYIGLGQFTDNKLFHNSLAETQSLNFTEIASAVNVQSPNDGGTAEWADFDNDGDLDLLANGVSNETWVLHKNQLQETATAQFINVTAVEGLAALSHVRGTLFFDMDNDGDLDILVLRGGGFRLYRNNRTDNSSLQVILHGTDSNSDGTGARLVLAAGGQQQIRCVYRNVIHDASGGWQGQQRIHFGLGNIDSIDELVIYWPSGCIQTLSDIPANQIIMIKESCVNEIPIDIKPQSCPNPLNVKCHGVLPVAILGTDDFDVATVDVASVRLTGVAPRRSAMKDVATPYEPFVGKQSEFDCTIEGPDGFLDLTLKFRTQGVFKAIEDALGRAVEDGEVLILTLTGNLLEEYGGAAIQGEDVVVIKKKGKKWGKKWWWKKWGKKRWKNCRKR